MPTLTLETGLALTDTGRATLFAPNDYAPTLRRAYKQAANNGNSNAAAILSGIMPDVDADEETCLECFAPIDSEPTADCTECENRLQEWRERCREEGTCPTCGSGEPSFCPC